MCLFVCKNCDGKDKEKRQKQAPNSKESTLIPQNESRFYEMGVRIYLSCCANHSFGDMPVMVLKVRKNVDSLVKPDSLMTAASFMSG